ncbi:MAG: type II toxin-antitoxin system prevent-host-death family antitoxin, partial [Deltaproteobacteria bacterium]|nr:type II toxin-antitoxin system prevent-host-death family antitoxin [Deltaproteobacteria bacterium]
APFRRRCNLWLHWEIRLTYRLIDHSHDYGHNRSMKTVSKGVLKAKMLEYLRWVQETGDELVVTDNNRPVVRIVAIAKRTAAADAFGDVRGRLQYHEDILAPTTQEWPES